MMLLIALGALAEALLYIQHIGISTKTILFLKFYDKFIFSQKSSFNKFDALQKKSLANSKSSSDLKSPDGTNVSIY